MKTKVAILLIIGIFLASCTSETATQESEVSTQAPATQESITAEEPIVTEIPTETPIACVTLLTPANGVEIPPVGKFTFSWTPMDEASKYILNIILPTGEIVPFETDQAFYDRYMEAFVSGGEYHWQVGVQKMDGSKICDSEFASFNKLAYDRPKGDGTNGGNGGADDETEPLPSTPPPINP